MKYFSTQNQNQAVASREAVIQGLAPDGGLFFPREIPKLSQNFFDTLEQLSLPDIGIVTLSPYFSDSLNRSQIEQITHDAFSFPIEMKSLSEEISCVELFHGPTLAFKDFGARFLARVMAHFVQSMDKELIILAATSGDTGSAVASGFFGVEGVRVVLLYPAGKVSELQEKQFTTLGGNITALEVDGTFDDCQRLVKSAFLDEKVRTKLFLSSANSINIGRFIPQMVYYFHAFARLKHLHPKIAFSTPSGNFGNLCSGLFAQHMGLPVDHFVAATNINDVVPEYLSTGVFTPRPSKQTISNAMDVGNPSNFARIQTLFGNSLPRMQASILGVSATDSETRAIIREVFDSSGYIVDPHTAVGIKGAKALLELKLSKHVAVLSTAHPAKFKNVIEETLECEVALPKALQECMSRNKVSIPLKREYPAFQSFLLNQT